MKALFRVTPAARRELDHEVVASDEVLGQRMTCVPRLIEARQGWTLYWTASDAGWAVRRADSATLFAMW